MKGYPFKDLLYCVLLAGGTCIGSYVPCGSQAESRPSLGTVSHVTRKFLPGLKQLVLTNPGALPGRYREATGHLNTLLIDLD